MLRLFNAFVLRHTQGGASGIGIERKEGGQVLKYL